MPSGHVLYWVEIGSYDIQKTHKTIDMRMISISSYLRIKTTVSISIRDVHSLITIQHMLVGFNTSSLFASSFLV